MIDAHAHIFSKVDGFSGENPTFGVDYGKVFDGSRVIQFMPPLCERTIHTPEMLLAQMDWAGVEQAVLLQGPFYGDCNEYVLAAVDKYPQRLIGMAYLDPWAAGISNKAAELLKTGKYAGVKLECSAKTGLLSKYRNARLANRDLDWLWEELERRQLVLTLDLGAPGSSSYQTDDVRNIALRHPSLRIVIAHLGQPGPLVAVRKDVRDAWVEQIELGQLPNVYFDTASLPHLFPDDRYPYTSISQAVKEAIERIGPDKVMWGTDVPGLLSVGTYPQLVEMAEINLQFLTEQDRAKVLHDNALLVYRRRA